MAINKNGRPGVLRVDTNPVPLSRKVEIQRQIMNEDGKPILDDHGEPQRTWVQLDGWVYGSRCPLSVKIQLMQALEDLKHEQAQIVVPQELRDIIRTRNPLDPMLMVEDDQGKAPPVDPAWATSRERVEQTYNRECLHILIPELTDDEADVLASDIETYRPIFTHLDYWTERPPEEADDDNPLPVKPAAKRSPSRRSSSSSRDSARSTVRTTGSQ